MTEISSIGSTQLFARAEEVLASDAPEAVKAVAALYALSFAAGETAQALGLTSPSNFGDIEALFAQIAAALDLQKADAETKENMSEVESLRSDSLENGRNIQELDANLSEIASILKDNSSTGFFLTDMFASIDSLLSSDPTLALVVNPLQANVLMATNLNVTHLNRSTDQQTDIVTNTDVDATEAEKTETEDTLTQQVEDPAKLEEMERERDRIRARLIEAGMNAEAANRVAGLGAALQAGLQNVLATLERLVGDASLFSAAVGAPQDGQKTKVHI